MKSLTRRNVLMLGGAAAIIPLVDTAADACPIIASRRQCDASYGPAPFRSRLDSVIKPATLDRRDGLVVRRKQDNSKLDTSVDIEYFLEDSGNRFFCRLPWAPDHGLAGACPTANHPPDHTFRFELIPKREGGKTKPDHVKVTINPDGKPDPCCFMCGGQEICIPPGVSYLCNGIEISCPA
jgi:hypothetical protein